MPSLFDMLDDPEERPLLLPFLRGEATAAERARYVAWLAARGDERGELLELTAALGAPGSAGSAGKRARFRVLVDRVSRASADWWAAVRPASWLLNCGLAAGEPPRVRFAFTCPRRWEELVPTGAPGVRSCEGCGELVYLTPGRREAEEHARAGRCIAVPAPLATEVGLELTRHTLGRPDPPSKWGDALFAATSAPQGLPDEPGEGPRRR
jgi:hypothetical protein